MARSAKLSSPLTIFALHHRCLERSHSHVCARLFRPARDGLFFEPWNVHPRFETPHVAIRCAGVWAAVLAISGSYELCSHTWFFRGDFLWPGRAWRGRVAA